MLTYPQDTTINALDDLGLNATTSNEVIALLEHGLPFSAFKHLQAALESNEEILAHAIQVPTATLARRKKTGKFTLEESDRLLRVGRLVSKANDLFSAPSAAATWFSRPARGLAGKTPLEYARTEVGAREVEALLERLIDGQAL